ncbi:acrosin-like [Babylonia areolata]|uniref:acrosin-like n=1 Tax=Babylonia areolata TaxID=304850 RepID=UPI003FD513FE
MVWRCFVLVGVLSTALMWPVDRAASVSECGRPTQHIPTENQGSGVGKRVVGGTPTTTRSFPWTVLIKRFGHSGVVCSGAILSERLVLTAAHCFDNLNVHELYLWAGRDEVDYQSNDQQLHFVASVAVHRTYNRTTKGSDIALLMTADPISMGPGVKTVCLPDAHTPLPPMDRCFLAGYGDTLGTGTDRRLNFIQVPVVDSSLCAQDDWLGTEFRRVQDVSFCAGYADGGPDACSGDSGAALVCPLSRDQHFYVYGVASWGKGCGERRKPGVYTRVPVFLDWITPFLDAPYH